MDQVYRCMKTLNVDDYLIGKTCIHIQRTMLLWSDLKLSFTPSAHLFEDHILNQMSSI